MEGGDDIPGMYSTICPKFVFLAMGAIFSKSVSGQAPGGLGSVAIRKPGPGSAGSRAGISGGEGGRVKISWGCWLSSKLHNHMGGEEVGRSRADRGQKGRGLFVVTLVVCCCSGEGRKFPETGLVDGG